jgi:hypothetical protein
MSRPTPPTTRSRSPGNADRKRRFRETARDILHMAKVKRQMGEAVDTAGAVARAMDQAYRMGYDDAVNKPTGSGTDATPAPASVPHSDAMEWTLIPPRTRSTFWSICLAALGRDGRTTTSSYLKAVITRRGTPAWDLVVPDRQPYEKSIGDGTIVTLLRLGLIEEANEEARVILSEYGIRTWNRFCERGGHWPDDLVEKLP